MTDISEIQRKHKYYDFTGEQPLHWHLEQFHFVSSLSLDLNDTLPRLLQSVSVKFHKDTLNNLKWLFFSILDCAASA